MYFDIRYIRITYCYYISVAELLFTLSLIIGNQTYIKPELILCGKGNCICLDKDKDFSIIIMSLSIP
jgi:hypothetical protein